MINKVIHQIWVGKYDIPNRELLLSKDIKEKHSDYEYYLWTDKNLPEIPERLQKMYDLMYENKDYVFCADMLRWLVVYEYGGWYLDIDWEFVQNLDVLNIDHRSGILFGHWGPGWQHCDYTLTNGVFAFEKNNPLVKYMIDNMLPKYDYFGPPYSPYWTGKNVKSYMGLEYDFSNEIWEYHRIMKENLEKYNIEYGDYNTFQNVNLRHHALYAWLGENKKKFEDGLIK